LVSRCLAWVRAERILQQLDRLVFLGYAIYLNRVNKTYPDMPKPLQFPTKLLIGVTPDFLGNLDNWRRKQDDLPTRSEAILRLVTAMLQVLDKDPGEVRGKPKKRKPA
jgi:hypothetical protein